MVFENKKIRQKRRKLTGRNKRAKKTFLN